MTIAGLFVLAVMLAVLAAVCCLVLFGLVNKEPLKLLVVPYFLLAALNVLQFWYMWAELQRINWICLLYTSDAADE